MTEITLTWKSDCANSNIKIVGRFTHVHAKVFRLQWRELQSPNISCVWYHFSFCKLHHHHHHHRHQITELIQTRLRKNKCCCCYRYCHYYYYYRRCSCCCCCCNDIFILIFKLTYFQTTLWNIKLTSSLSLSSLMSVSLTVIHQYR